MHPPTALPQFLTERESAQLHRFDLVEQRAPNCASFSGVRVLCDLVSPSEEQALLQTFDGFRFSAGQSGQEKLHFGARYNFKQRRLNLDGFRPLPSFARDLEIRAHAAGVTNFRMTDAFVLRYRADRSANLDFHVDDDFAYGEQILGLSLESDSRITFLPETQRRRLEEVAFAVSVPVPARSLLIISGAARYRWSHGILARDIVGRRTSLTLRSASSELIASEAGRRLYQQIEETSVAET